MHSPFRGLRRGNSRSAGSLNSSAPTSTSNFSSYPYPRTHTTLVVLGGQNSQRERPLFDDSPTSANSSVAANRPFHRPPLNRAIPPIPESRSNESIGSQASQLTHRHSISGTSSLAGASLVLSQRETTITVPNKPSNRQSLSEEKTTDLVIANRMAQNLGAKLVTTTVSPPSSMSTNTPPATISPLSTNRVVKKSVAIITTRPTVIGSEEKAEDVKVETTKPTRLPLTTKKKTRTPTTETPKSPLLSMAQSVRSRLGKLGTRIGRATSKSPIRSSYSMLSMRRDQSNLATSPPSNQTSRLLKSTSLDHTTNTRSPPPLPASSPPMDDELIDATRLPPRHVFFADSPANVPRRLPVTTLITTPPGCFHRRLAEEEDRRAAAAAADISGPILAIDTSLSISTPDCDEPPAILLRKTSEVKQTPLQQKPQPNFVYSPTFSNTRRGHRHSHSFGGVDNQQARTPKATARLIVRQPSAPLPITRIVSGHRRSKSRDAIIEMATPRVIFKKPIGLTPDSSPSTIGGLGSESVKTTRSLKIVATTGDVFAPTTPATSRKPGHKKSSSVDFATATASKIPIGNRNVCTITTSASAGKADDLRLRKSYIPKRTVNWINKRHAPLAKVESSQVGNSPAVEMPPISFDETSRGRAMKTNIPTARSKRIVFWRSKSKSATERSEPENADKDRNGNTRSVDETSEFRSLTARITTRSGAETAVIDSNGNEISAITPKIERESRRDRLSLNELLRSPLTSHRRPGKSKAKEKQRSGLIDDEITDQPSLITTELSLIDERSESTPSQTYVRDLNENFEAMNTTIVLSQDADGNTQRAVRRETEQSTTPAQFVSTTTTTTQQLSAVPQQPCIHPAEQAAIDKVIEDLSSQLDRIREYAIEDEDEMKKLRKENSSLKEELEIKDRVIHLLMNRLKDPMVLASNSQLDHPTTTVVTSHQ
ncbi:hypothetical protein M3Y95_00157000 [Aphelenchoides besseyi]|nr:hypothetical protein M3Y95_00157000 [Aphelenchoides besseyi]